jgi:hypothetical protein
VAYSVSKGKVLGTDVPPPEEPEDESAYEVTVPLGDKCPHGYFNHAACIQCFPIAPNHSETKQLPITVSLYIDVYAFTALKVGALVCRRIRPEVIGMVKSISYAFKDSTCMRDVWVDFSNSGRSTPYQPTELLLLKVN